MCMTCDNPTYTWIDVYYKTDGHIRGKMCQPCEENYLLQISMAATEQQ